MKVSVCSLFEFSYSDGAGVLANSLILNGFVGHLIFGYRGSLPLWTRSLRSLSCSIPSVHRFELTSDVLIDFVLLETRVHLTNYKPQFIFDLFLSSIYSFDALLYLDCDIVVNERWSFFEDWLSCGVALCEDVNSPYHPSHPRRRGWRMYFGSDYKYSNPMNNVYVNGGAVGVRREDLGFIECWLRLTNAMALSIGGLEAAKVVNGAEILDKGFARCFDATDQDSLNAALDNCTQEVSILGKEAMAFKSGHSVLPHAIGHQKPWNKNFLHSIMVGRSSRLVDKLFWFYADKPIAVKPKSLILSKKMIIFFSRLVSRFYSVNGQLSL